MTQSSDASPAPLKGLGGIKRRAVSVATEALVKTSPLFPDGDLPLLVEPAVEGGINLASWAAANREMLQANLLRCGGILFRGFNVQGPEDLESVIQAVSDESLEYRERSSPRTAVSGNIYTSTDYPPSYPIFLHNENSYQSQWPQKIFFLCTQPAEEGGATPIADCRRVLRHIDPEIRDRFGKQGWMYVRNFGDGFGLSWETVFQTTDKIKVEEHCRRNGIETEWKEDGRLRTHAVRPALVRHPRTGETLWFNHATFFHVSTLDPAIAAGLLEEFDESELPTNTFYGDGSPIEPEVMEHLRAAYRRETVSFPWQKGDLLMLDNMLVAHGRAPFAGPRRVLVGMAEAVAREQVLLATPENR
ncbi:MAG TPA: TauD/TfdA family dioxygenase [Thermoanaerobaculia bacterium]|jgi:alpha-ketoglutarate-dependent taurine dioxygenase|nr:TauD/TfdA family dioxygenase [Thermoanaerobaculia bacterium]